MKEITIIGAASVDESDPNSRAIGDVIAMQLSSITYCSLTNNVASTLANYLPNWQLVWQPTAAIEGDWAFIAYNGIQYVIAIRGSILNFSWGSFDNWFRQDFNVLEQVPWVYTNDTSTDPMISKGSSEGLTNLINLVDANGDTMFDYLSKNAFPNNALIGVTGHSLGANLATVYGAWLRYELLQSGYTMPPVFSIMTFASATSWNKAFVDQYDANFTNSWRYYNELDIVPFGAERLLDLTLLYDAPAPKADTVSVTVDGKVITLSDAFIGLAAAIEAAQIAYGSYYTPVNANRGAVPLNTSQSLFPVDTTKSLLDQWFSEAGNQHAHNHYLKWLGSPPLDCTD
jgi:hypothetical protein